MNDCIGGYYRIRKAKRDDPKEVYRREQQRTGNKHPETIVGYAGLFFGKGDVFVSKAVGQCMEAEDFREFVYRCLHCYERENYGDISKGDIEINSESRWIGNGERVVGRYGYFYNHSYIGKRRYDEIIRIRTWKGNIWITYDSEPDLFLLLKDGKESGEQVKEEKAIEAPVAEQPTEKDGVEFLKEYRAHPDRYLPMGIDQYIHVDEQEGDKTNLFWNAGIVEDNRPYFATCWKFAHVTNLDIFVSAEGMERWDAQHLFVLKMVRRGLLEVDDIRKIPVAVFNRTDHKGREFYMIHLTLKDDTRPVQDIRWVGNEYSFEELNRLNANLRWIV